MTQIKDSSNTTDDKEMAELGRLLRDELIQSLEHDINSINSSPSLLSDRTIRGKISTYIDIMRRDRS